MRVNSIQCITAVILNRTANVIISSNTVTAEIEILDGDTGPVTFEISVFDQAIMN